MADKKKLALIGASGHCKVVIDVIERQGNDEIVFIIDDNPALAGAKLFGYSIAGTRDVLLEKASTAGIDFFIIAIGNNSIRNQISEWLLGKGLRLATAIHPSAQIGRGTRIGAGTVVMAGAVINSDAEVGSNTIINTGATVDHDCQIGDFVHIAPGVHICGGVSIQSGSLVGAGATVIPNVSVGSNVVIGAGSTVLTDIGDNQKVAGSPARVISDV